MTKKNGIIIPSMEEIIELNRKIVSEKKKGKDKTKYYTRLILYPDGTKKTIKVTKKKADKFLNKLLKEDKEMLDILKKL